MRHRIQQLQARNVLAGRLLLVAASSGLAATPAAAVEPTGAILVVDRDRAQCASAGFMSIQAAVDVAEPGDLVRVCPDRYSESVVVDKPLTIKGDPEAVEVVDCFQRTPSQLGDLDPTRQAIVDPAGDGFTIALKLNANDIVVEGLVVEGASVGIDASDRFSGYRIHHNLIRLTTLFAIDLGSEGTRESRADHNCLRENQYGLMSELDDNSPGAERDAGNARNLRNARIDRRRARAERDRRRAPGDRQRRPRRRAGLWHRRDRGRHRTRDRRRLRRARPVRPVHRQAMRRPGAVTAPQSNAPGANSSNRMSSPTVTESSSLLAPITPTGASTT